MINIDGLNIYVRTNTPDLRVALRSLVDKEEDGIRSSDPGYIIDGGAYIGTTAIFFAEKYPNARVIAVEPEQDNFELLLRNTSGHKNIVPIRAAIWGKDDKRTIQNRFTGPWGYTVADTPNRTESTGQDAECITVPSIKERFGIESIDLLKMDIEGAEKNVLENSSDWIDSVNVLAVELHEGTCKGCVRAFYVSTKDFRTVEKHGEKLTAYRKCA